MTDVFHYCQLLVVIRAFEEIEYVSIIIRSAFFFSRFECHNPITRVVLGLQAVQLADCIHCFAITNFTAIKTRHRIPCYNLSTENCTTKLPYDILIPSAKLLIMFIHLQLYFQNFSRPTEAYGICWQYQVKSQIS